MGKLVSVVRRLPGHLRCLPVHLRRVPAFLGSLVAAVWHAIIGAVVRAFEFVDAWLFDRKKALYGLAVTRILFGCAALGILASNFNTRLYAFGAGSAWNGELRKPVSDFPRIWLFSLFHKAAGNDFWFTVLYLVLAAIAVLFVLGWRFRVVHPVFFVMWVSFIEMNDMLGDQGDNMFRIVLILLFFADPAARWSLDARRRGRRGEWFAPGSSWNQIGTVLHNLALVTLTLQVAFAYAAGGLYKAQGDPWVHGYAVYNPLHTARFGTWPVLSDLATHWGPVVAIATWGSVLMQILFLVMLIARPTRLLALFAILSFHVAIGVLMGLPWFSLTMIAVDAIFIRDRTWRRLADGLTQRWRAAAGTQT